MPRVNRAGKKTGASGAAPHPPPLVLPAWARIAVALRTHTAALGETTMSPLVDALALGRDGTRVGVREHWARTPPARRQRARTRACSPCLALGARAAVVSRTGSCPGVATVSAQCAMSVDAHALLPPWPCSTAARAAHVARRRLCARGSGRSSRREARNGPAPASGRVGGPCGAQPARARAASARRGRRPGGRRAPADARRSRPTPNTMPPRAPPQTLDDVVRRAAA